MTFRKTSHRWALWAFAAALLLKSAMPWLASVSAEMQGKALVEVCTVYGVKTIAIDGSGASEPTPEGHASHGAEHCALGGLLVGGALEAPVSAPPLAASACTALATPVPPHPAPPDACAAWGARLKHGPPTFV